MEAIQLKHLVSCQLTSLEIEVIQELLRSSNNCDSKKKKAKYDKYGFLLDVLCLSITDLTRFKFSNNKILEVLSNSEKLLSIYNKGRLYHIKGFMAWRNNDSVVTASHYLNNSIEVLTRKKTKMNLAYLARVHNTWGQILVRRGQIEEAIEEYVHASNYRKINNDIEGYAITQGNIGRLYYDKGNYLKAKQFLEIDIKIIESISIIQEKTIAHLKTNIALCEIELDNNNHAFELLSQSLLLNRKNKNEIGLCFCYLGLANLYYRIKETIKSEESIEMASSFIDSEAIPEYLQSEIKGELFRIKGENNTAKKEYDLAIENFSNADLEFNSISNFSPIRKSKLLFRLAKAYKGKGDFSKSAELMRKSLRFADISDDFDLRDLIEKDLGTGINKDSLMLHSAGRFLGHQLVDFLIEQSGKQSLKSEIKDVVVLFSDIRDFTTISEKMEPDYLVRFLNKYMEMMTRSIEYYNGFIDKYIGDAIMSLFMIQSTRGKRTRNEVELASWAAIFMLEELKRFNRVKAPKNLELETGIGIHTGKAVVGLIGSPQKRSYTALGDTVNLASRIEGLTKLLGAQILITEDVLKKYKKPEQFLFSYWGKYVVKGRVGPIALYELLGINDNSLHCKNLRKEIVEKSIALTSFEKGDLVKSIKQFSELVVKYKSTKRNQGYQYLKSIAEKSIAKEIENWDGVIILDKK